MTFRYSFTIEFMLNGIEYVNAMDAFHQPQGFALTMHNRKKSFSRTFSCYHSHYPHGDVVVKAFVSLSINLGSISLSSHTKDFQIVATFLLLLNSLVRKRVCSGRHTLNQHVYVCKSPGKNNFFHGFTASRSAPKAGVKKNSLQVVSVEKALNEIPPPLGGRQVMGLSRSGGPA